MKVKLDIESIASDVMEQLKLAAGGQTVDEYALDELCQRITSTWFAPSQGLVLWTYLELARGLNAGCRKVADRIGDCIGLKAEEIVSARMWCEQVKPSVKGLTVAQLLASPPAGLSNQLTVFIARLCKGKTATVRLKGLHMDEFRREDESSWLLSMVRAIPGFESQLSALASAVEQAYLSVGRVMLRSSALDVKLAKIPDIQTALQRACSALDYSQELEVYVMHGAQDMKMVGIRRPAILIPSAIVSTHDADELTFIIGREIGKLICDHQRILAVLDRTYNGAASLDIGFLAAAGMSLTVNKWRRAAGLTCDRAGLLACQSIEVANRVYLKEMGYPVRTAGNMPAWILEELIAEREQLQSSGRMEGVFDKGLNWTFNTFRSELPPLERAYRLHCWVSQGGFAQVMRREGTKRPLQNFSGLLRPKSKVDVSDSALGTKLLGTK